MNHAHARKALAEMTRPSTKSYRRKTRRGDNPTLPPVLREHIAGVDVLLGDGLVPHRLTRPTKGWISVPPDVRAHERYGAQVKPQPVLGAMAAREQELTFWAGTR